MFFSERRAEVRNRRFRYMLHMLLCYLLVCLHFERCFYETLNQYALRASARIFCAEFSWRCNRLEYLCKNTGFLQMNDAVSKVNKKFISHLTRAQRTPSAAATVQVSHELPAFRFSCLLRGLFPRWRRSRKRLSVCSVLRCPDLWLPCSVSFVRGLEKTHHTGIT